MPSTQSNRDQAAIAARFEVARTIVHAAATSALSLFRDPAALQIDSKGRQDWVSNADRSVENEIRQALGDAFPDDAILGEEHDDLPGTTGFTWVIDPIDGTTSFVNNLPGWCVVLACVDVHGTVLGVIRDPVADETWTARTGHGAQLNGHAIQPTRATSLDQGSTAVGHNSRIDPQHTERLIHLLLADHGIFYRCGSGALMLVYVASGRLLGYCEPHMNAWDCLAAMLVIDEAGGRVQPFDQATMLARGGRVIAGGEGVYERLVAISQEAYGPLPTA